MNGSIKIYKNMKMMFKMSHRNHSQVKKMNLSTEVNYQCMFIQILKKVLMEFFIGSIYSTMYVQFKQLEKVSKDLEQRISFSK